MISISIVAKKRSVVDICGFQCFLCKTQTQVPGRVCLNGLGKLAKYCVFPSMMVIQKKDRKLSKKRIEFYPKKKDRKLSEKKDRKLSEKKDRILSGKKG